MSNITITSLPIATSVSNTDIVPIVQQTSTTNKKASLLEVRKGMGSSLTITGTPIDETSSRATATIYANSSGAPLHISVTLQQTAAGTGEGILQCDTVTPPILEVARIGMNAAGLRFTLQFVVPASSFYRVIASNATLTSWIERPLMLGAATPAAGPTLAHWFLFDETTPPIVDAVTAEVASITGVDYTLGVPGVHGSTGILFEGAGNAYVETAALPPTTGLSKGFSWLVWAKRTSDLIPDEFPYCMDQRAPGSSAGNGLVLLIDDNSSYRPFIDTGPGNLFANAGNTMPLNTWRHIAVTYDGEFLRLYVDGLAQTATLTNGALMDNVLTLPLRMGRSSRAGALTGGSHCALDDARIYTKPLNESEIQAVMTDPNYVITGLWRHGNQVP